MTVGIASPWLRHPPRDSIVAATRSARSCPRETMAGGGQRRAQRRERDEMKRSISSAAYAQPDPPETVSVQIAVQVL